MGGKHAYRPTVLDNLLESRVALSHAGIISHLRHVAAAHHGAVRRHPAAHHGHTKTTSHPPIIVVTSPGAPQPASSSPPTTFTFTPPPVSSPPPPITTDPPPPPPPPPVILPVQNLSATSMTAAQFNGLFSSIGTAPAMSASFQYQGGAGAGVVESQVFQGTGAASGLYAYAYQIDVSSGPGLNLQNTNMKFGGALSGTDLTGTGHANAVYLVQDGPIGNLDAPQAGLAPTGVSVQPSATGGPSQLIATFNATAQAGAHSVTFVVLSNQAPTQQFVNIAGADPSLALAYAPH